METFKISKNFGGKLPIRWGIFGKLFFPNKEDQFLLEASLVKIKGITFFK